MDINKAKALLSSVYGDVEWVDVLCRYSPKKAVGLAYVAEGIFNRSVLPEKVKHFILLVIYLSQGRADLVKLHAQLARSAGASDAELIETLEVFLPSRGVHMFSEGLRLIGVDAQTLPAPEDADAAHEPVDVVDMLAYFESVLHGLPPFVTLLAEHKPELLQGYYVLRSENLREGVLLHKYKELLLVALNTSERYTEGARIHVVNAMENGASAEEVVDAMTTAILSGGVPGWIEGSKAFVAGSQAVAVAA
ncbi:carboxymuconolactone decarboxylase family protein [Parapusillimonas granuli]|uniref:Carboxymuconolactone decarboxylase family protein n=1 Tax=Parapusillimonas granuli TaxID=380911 RepID=A0A853G3Q7_9BURK|nr:carboxymuconolactone decarboxylase family protein [Parapusillimonas granuli]MBB5216446.1 alkylhydroperoxidase/carboxymuconolactone decarboxylase family protein YurZ [Parapusillimonas granuli]NYT51513.1 carboxymuconolactone decarboxylase family protein [Parapusillimonas granuli]